MTALLAACCLALAADPAAQDAGEGTRVGVLPLVIESDAAPEVGDARERLSQEVQRTFDDSRYETLLLDADEAGDAAKPYCGDSVCWQQLATQYDVTHFLVMVVRFEEPDYQVDARLIDGRTGEDAGAQTMTCDLCGLAELGSRVSDVAATMRREVEATLVPPPTLIVTSQPPGAMVMVDGEAIGRAPIELQTVAGEHRIVVEHPDHIREQLDVELVDGVRRELTVRLRPRPAPVVTTTDSGSDGRGTMLLGVGAATLAAGVGAIVGGAVMLAIDDEPIERDCDGDNVDALGRCRYLHDTLAGGIGLTVGGVALVGAGVALTIIGAKRRKKKRRRTAIVPSGRGFAIVGRF